MKTTFSEVEKSFLNDVACTTRMPYIVIENFPKLGLLTALRFLEWVSENPQGNIALPTGKTPEFFIKFTQHILNNWDTSSIVELREQHHLICSKPVLNDLRFIQLDEFYPISSIQKNSFCNYVRNFYLKGFGLNEDNSLLIDCDKIPLANGKAYPEIFPDNTVDLTLRTRNPKSKLEELQQTSIYLLDDFCKNYEQRIREMGGIGFFLGGIGPDGHIAFNMRGSDHYSTTRLTETNFETQAVSASDLGGIEVSRNRLVITMGLGTVTYNPDATVIIFAAGEAKAPMVRSALEEAPHTLYPATALHKLPNARFYITNGAAFHLNDVKHDFYKSGEWSEEKTDRAIFDLLNNNNLYADTVKSEDMKADEFGALLPNASSSTIEEVKKRTIAKIERGLKPPTGEVYLHTGPHHDDVMLGMLPYVSKQIQSENNEFHFAVLTSGFTAVTNDYVIELLEQLLSFIDEDKIQILNEKFFYQEGFKKRFKDAYHYLSNIPTQKLEEQKRAISHNLARILTEVYSLKDKTGISKKAKEIIDTLRNSYEGEKNPTDIQTVKGMLREFEEELVWAGFGISQEQMHHLRLGFYTGDIFTEQPNKERDVLPMLELLRKIKPTVVSLAFDPEGSGPDTHYKVLQVIADALRIYREEADVSNLKVHGYRNVWYKFHPADTNVIVPLSANDLAILDKSFSDCYLSQVNASFPSYMLDGKFSTLASQIWADQLRQLQLLLGKEYFYQNENPNLRNAHATIFFNEMTIDEFLSHARELEKTTEGVTI